MIAGDQAIVWERTRFAASMSSGTVTWWTTGAHGRLGTDVPCNRVVLCEIGDEVLGGGGRDVTPRGVVRRVERMPEDVCSAMMTSRVTQRFPAKYAMCASSHRHRIGRLDRLGVRALLRGGGP